MAEPILSESAVTEPAVAEQALAAFDHMLASTAGFRPRPGQREMARRIAESLAAVDLGQHPDPRQAIAVIQAGTGVGKSAAYLSTVFAMALARKTRVLISTATVALQEQLLNKDLAALAAVTATPFVYALAKGRGRYVCQLKLERLAGCADDELDLLAADEYAAPEAQVKLGLGEAGPALQQRRLDWYDSLARALAAGRWDGDVDSLAEQPDRADWRLLAAERHSCTARQCPHFRACSYYRARSALVQAQVIVANHDLVLASLGKKALPELDNCLLVFDEAHHLPAVALDQFSVAMDLSGLSWLDKLPKILRQTAVKMALPEPKDVAASSQQLKAALQDVGRMALDLLRQADWGYDAVYRFADGMLAPELLEPMQLIYAQAQALSALLQALGDELKKRAREDPAQAGANAAQYAQLGQMAAKLSSVLDTSAMLLTHQEQPMAKWLRASSNNGLVFLSAHACPIVPGELLRQHLWSHVRGAVLTSATLASCGSFAYFLSECGLDKIKHVSTLAVDSPFNYAQQGQLLVVETRADPRQVECFTKEMAIALMRDLRQVRHGALVLFTSRLQMQAVLEMLDAGLLACVLVQGQLSRKHLLHRHQTRLQSGLASVIFGLQSFGEGLDLPGQLCETVFITKLPFAAVADPVGQARTEWLKRQGRNPFTELVVPAAGVRLLQWTGRAIRSESDQARVVCYDKRLLSCSYGRRMLQGLPPYAVSRQVLEPVPLA